MSPHRKQLVPPVPGVAGDSELFSDFTAGFGSVFVSGVDSAFASVLLSEVASLAPAAAFASAPGLSPAGFDPPLKSVAYQPLPFNWKAAAETILTSAAASHDGQSTSGASASFCSASSLWP